MFFPCAHCSKSSKASCMHFRGRTILEVGLLNNVCTASLFTVTSEGVALCYAARYTLGFVMAMVLEYKVVHDPRSIQQIAHG
jgi:hypothetical protein